VDQDPSPGFFGLDQQRQQPTTSCQPNEERLMRATTVLTTIKALITTTLREETGDSQGYSEAAFQEF